MTTANAYPIATPERDALETEVIDIVRQLSPDELRVFRFMGRRMIDIGHVKYGPLDLSVMRRIWSKEQAQETADRLFYAQCEEIAAEDARADRISAFIAAADLAEMSPVPPVDYCLHIYVDGVCAECRVPMPRVTVMEGGES